LVKQGLWLLQLTWPWASALLQCLKVRLLQSRTPVRVRIVPVADLMATAAVAVGLAR
jgi:hypothetical protein